MVILWERRGSGMISIPIAELEQLIDALHQVKWRLVDRNEE